MRVQGGRTHRFDQRKLALKQGMLLSDDRGREVSHSCDRSREGSRSCEDLILHDENLEDCPRIVC